MEMVSYGTICPAASIISTMMSPFLHLFIAYYLQYAWHDSAGGYNDINWACMAKRENRAWAQTGNPLLRLTPCGLSRDGRARELK